MDRSNFVLKKYWKLVVKKKQYLKDGFRIALKSMETRKASYMWD